MSKPFCNAPEDNKFFPRLKTLLNIPAPCCVLRFLCRLSAIVWDLLIVTFHGKFFLLTLSYLTKKDCPLGNVTRYAVTFCLKKIFFLYISSTPTSFTSKYLFKTTPLNEPNMGAANAPIGKNPPLYLRLFCLPPLYQTPHLNDCFFILKSHHLLVQCYMFCDVKLTPTAITLTNTHQVNMSIFLTLFFW